MKIQLQEYFQNRLPKHNYIETTLSPLLNQVKSNKINSIHQLRSKLQNYTDTAQQYSQSPSINQTLHVFPNNNEVNLKKQSFSYSQKVSPSHKNKLISTIESHGKTSRSKRQKYGTCVEERIVFVNPVSKVKKHLIDNIDFKQIQRAMYHQPNKTNKYQSFFQALTHKRMQTSPRKVKSVSKNKKSLNLVDNDQAMVLRPTNIYDPEEKIFRITQKRCFWVQTRSNNKRKNPNCTLEITSLGKAICIE